jgi:hypothetical protein
MSASAVVTSMIFILNVRLGARVIDHQVYSYQKNVTSGNMTILTDINRTYYLLDYHFLIDPLTSNIWNIVFFIVRDFFIVTAILVLNILILRVITQMVKTRRDLFRGDGDNDAMQAALKAEKKKLIIGVNYFVGHSINFVYQVFYFPFPFHYSKSILGCLNFLVDVFFSLSYAAPFLFYYFLNTRFKKEANNLLFYSLFKKYFKRVVSGSTNI